MNIAKILKNCPEGRELYCTAICVIRYIGMYGDRIKFRSPDGIDVITNDDGRVSRYENAECIIFPSFNCRDWSKWAEVLINDGDIVALKDGKVVRFDYTRINYDDIARFASEDELTDEKQDEKPTGKAIFVPKAIFEPYDKVLVADRAGEHWQCNLFSNYIDDIEMPSKFRCLTNPWKFCIPFEGNENLVGTKVTEEQVAEIKKTLSL